MTKEEQPGLPRTEEVVLLGATERSVEELAGTILLERYRLLELLGEGGASVVYRAEHTIMHKPMAVKILRPEHVARPDLVRRFLGEARTVARLRHENIVDIVDIGRTESGVVFCVMEWLDGEDLGGTIERDGPLPWPRAQRIVLQVCRALVAAHREGIVHRDVKPQNCFRIRRGHDRDFIKLLDFGIAKEVAGGQKMTATGVVMGTAGYMPPEQARGEPIDERADVYAVGALLFELVSGRPAFEGNNYLDVLLAQLSRPPPLLSTVVAELPAGLEELVSRALASKAGDRYASMTELATAIIHVDRGAAPVAPPAVDVGSRPVRRASAPRVRVVALSAALLVPTIIAFVIAASADDPVSDAEPAEREDPSVPIAASDPAAARDPGPAALPEIVASAPAVATPSPASADTIDAHRRDDRRRRADRRRDGVPPTAARPPMGSSRAQVERRLQTACADRVGFEAKTVRITTHPEASPKVVVEPPSAPLKRCVEQHLPALSLARVAATLAVKLHPKAAP